MESRIKRVMGNVFNIDVDSVNNDSSPDNIRNWDSLKQMELIIFTEKALKKKLKLNDILRLKSFSDLIKLLKIK